jgi:Astacin (Peptidase family M12A)
MKFPVKVNRSILIHLLPIAICITHSDDIRCSAQDVQNSNSDGKESVVQADPNANFFDGYLVDPETQKVALVTMQNVDGLAVIQGDIILGTVEELSHPGSDKAVQYTKSKLWPNAVIPYLIPSGFANDNVLHAAISEFNSRTKIRFVTRTNEHDYIQFAYTDNIYIGGQSMWGRSGGAQPLCLNRDTTKWNKGIVEHELCHALGLGHEQCRSDRDKYVTIHLENVRHGYEEQFKPLGPKLGKDILSYDYYSVTEYPGDAFSVGGQTIVPTKAGVILTQQNSLSKVDCQALDTIYADEIAKREGAPGSQ